MRDRLFKLMQVIVEKSQAECVSSIFPKHFKSKAHKKTNRKMIESLSDDEWAKAIDEDGFTSLQDKICLEMCPSQDCEPQDSGQCKECIKRWLQKAVE